MNNMTQASSTGADVVRRFYSALQSGDMAAAAGCLSAGVVLHVPGRHQLAGDYQGLEGVARFAAATQALAAGGARTTVLDVLSGDGHVAALCRVDGSRGDAVLENRTIHLARLEEGRIAEVWYHNFDQHSVDAFWGTRQ